MEPLWLIPDLSHGENDNNTWHGNHGYDNGVHGYPVPEPTPDWTRAREVWGWSWNLHRIVFGILYIGLGVYSTVACVLFKRRLRVQQCILGINGLLLLLATTRAVFLLVDPYESAVIMPVAFTRVLYSIAFPCLTSAFSLVQLVFMRITRVSMGPNKLQNYRVLAAIITSHFTIVIVIDITVACRNNLKLLLLICQSVFITWSLVLCFGFIYGGFRISQFTTETQRVLRQLAVYQRVKQEVGKDSTRRDLALHRISKPKLRILEEDTRSYSGLSDATSGADSSDSLSFFNEAHFEFDEEMIAQACITSMEARSAGRNGGDTVTGNQVGNSIQIKSRHRRGQCPHTAPYPVSNEACQQLLPSGIFRDDSSIELSSETELLTDTPSTPGQTLAKLEQVISEEGTTENLSAIKSSDDAINSTSKAGEIADRDIDAAPPSIITYGTEHGSPLALNVSDLPSSIAKKMDISVPISTHTAATFSNGNISSHTYVKGNDTTFPNPAFGVFVRHNAPQHCNGYAPRDKHQCDLDINASTPSSPPPPPTAATTTTITTTHEQIPSTSTSDLAVQLDGYMADTELNSPRPKKKKVPTATLR